MTELAKKTSKDTDVVRTLTLIALTYLPASLVAVSALFLGYFREKPADHLSSR